MTGVLPAFIRCNNAVGVTGGALGSAAGARIASSETRTIRS